MSSTIKLVEDKTKIYLFRGRHPIYEALVRAPPEGVDYVPKAASLGREEYTLYNPFKSQTRAIVNSAFRVFNVPRVIPVLRRYDLVHSCRGFVVVGKNNFVVDFEHVSSFVGMQHYRLESEVLRKRLDHMLCSPNCARLLPHSRAALQSLLTLPSKRVLENKSTVVYPVAIAPDHVPERIAKKDPPRILFYGEYYWKGGREVIEACERLSRRLDFTLTYISNRVHPPRDVIARAEKTFNLEYIEGPIPREKLFQEVYPNSDIFVMPSYLDTLGFGFMEAMAHGIPCVGARIFAVPEIIEHGTTGMLVDPPVQFYDGTGMGHPEIDIKLARTGKTVEALSVAIDELISSARLRSTMGTEGRRTVTDGRLSVRARNVLLRQVYEESIRH